MGVAFSHCEARWSYTGFANFRRELWKLAGFAGDLYELYNSNGHEVAKAHPLFPLFNHSDCDDILTPEEMEKVAPELERLAPQLSDSYDRMMGLRLAQGMRAAMARAENLQFH